jgi:hypothetical protein
MNGLHHHHYHHHHGHHRVLHRHQQQQHGAGIPLHTTTLNLVAEGLDREGGGRTYANGEDETAVGVPERVEKLVDV